MIHEIHIPQQGVTSNTAMIAKWETVQGQYIKKDQVLVILETDKATYELNAPADGYLHILQPEGSTLQMGTLIGLLADTTAELEGLSVSHPSSLSGTGTETAASVTESRPSQHRDSGKDKIKIAGIARTLAEKHGLDPVSISGSGPGGRITKDDVEKAIRGRKATDDPILSPRPAIGAASLKISGIARALAEKHHLDLTGVSGTGPGGKISIEDVQNLLGIPPKPDHTMPAGTSETLKEQKQRTKKVFPFKGKVKVMADRLVESLRAMAPMTHWEEVDMTELIAFRSWANQSLKERGDKISFGDLFVKITAQAIKENPLLNSSIEGEEIKIWEEINIGMAVAVGENLVVPIIRNADRKTVIEISQAVKEIAAKARENRLDSEDISGGTITITNIGSFGANPGTPIIHLPEVAIIGFGRIEKKPVVRNDEIVIRPLALISVTVDHRVITGAVAARFRLRLKELLEDPKRMLLTMI